jgi:hypothetical protein
MPGIPGMQLEFGLTVRLWSHTMNNIPSPLSIRNVNNVRGHPRNLVILIV